jgi:hypothetical protein
LQAPSLTPRLTIVFLFARKIRYHFQNNQKEVAISIKMIMVHMKERGDNMAACLLCLSNSHNKHQRISLEKLDMNLFVFSLPITPLRIRRERNPIYGVKKYKWWSNDSFVLLTSTCILNQVARSPFSILIGFTTFRVDHVWIGGIYKWPVHCILLGHNIGYIYIYYRSEGRCV